jgi:phage tail sheath protein FI
MAETVIVSPGVLAIENDQSFITQQPVQAGAAIIGPTPKGKVGIPVLCTTYSDYLNKFGSTFLSGSQTYTYFTSIAAYNYFNSGGNTLLVTRVVSGSTSLDWTPATSSAIPSSTALTSASLSVNLTYISASLASVGSQSLNINGITLFYTGSATVPANTSTVIYIGTGSFTTSTVADYVATSSAIFNFSSSIALYSASLQFISSSNSSPSLLLTSTNPNGLTGNSYFVTSGSTTTNFTGGTNTTAFVLETLSEGIIMNSTGPTGSFGTLLSGSADNFRWQIASPNINDGTFSLLIRQGNDSDINQSVVESWGPLSLDPFAANYIEKVIGNQVETILSDNNEYYIQLTGSYQNNSSIIRVKQVNQTTPNYLDNNGVFQPQFTGSLPITSSGTFGSAKGTNIPSVAGNYYETITSNNIQGLTANAYTESISLLANKDAYKYNVLVAPGLISSHGAPSSTAITQIQTTVQERGDAIAVIDLVPYNATIGTVTSTVSSYNTPYMATYWPWLKTLDPNTANQVWVPASTMIPSVYAFNDSVAAPWFAPAGINRGILPTVIQAERILTQGNRDTLYQSNVNAIATFPGAGIVVFGQKTLQKKKSALDRVNVRRLLIELKNYISQVADTFVFEQNDANTRSELLSIINPYLSSIQQQQGLTSFKVIMDESNNPPSVVDQNQLVGQIYLQPTRTIEFILLDFNILPTGAVFPA